MDLTEAENIKKRWQTYTEELYTNLNDADNHDAVITQLEPDTLECEVKWALGSITTKLVEMMEFQLSFELFQILKDDAIKVMHSICHQIWKTQQQSQDWKRSFFHFNPKEGQCQTMFKLLYNCSHFTG